MQRLGLVCLLFWGVGTIQIGLGGFRFNRGSPSDAGEDPRTPLYDLIDHLEAHYRKDQTWGATLSGIRLRDENVSAPQIKFSSSPERCQLTACKVGDSFRLTSIDLLQPGLRKLYAGYSGVPLDEACMEVSSYDPSKLRPPAKGDPPLSRAFISGQLQKGGNQARGFKVILSKLLRVFLGKLDSPERAVCTLGLVKEYLKTELASFSQTYQQKNFENGIAIKLASIQSRLEAIKRESKDLPTLQKKLDSVRLKGSHAVILRVPREGLAHSLATKVFVPSLLRDILAGVKVGRGNQTLKRGRMTTFLKLFEGSSKATRTGVAVVFLKRDRNCVALALFNHEFSHQGQKNEVVNVDHSHRQVLLEKMAYASLLKSQLLNELFRADGVLA